MKIQIDCTRELLKMSAMCGTDDQSLTSKNCWIAYAVRKIFPDVQVESSQIHFPDFFGEELDMNVPLPSSAQEMIEEFDFIGMVSSTLEGVVKARMDLEPFSFTIDFPDKCIDRLNKRYGYSLGELESIINGTEHLHLV